MSVLEAPMSRIVAFLFVILAINVAHADERFITLSSTTSTQDSGLFGYILPIFKSATGIDVHVVAVGTGQALAIGERGDADALLVHDRVGEDKFVADGFGIDRRDVMYNDFVIVGPSTNPAHIRGLKDARKALTLIADAKAPFASRGDDSGTNRMELRLWKSAGIQPDPHSGWYRDLGQGMGATLNIAAGMNAYTLTDRATWANFKNRQGLKSLSMAIPCCLTPTAAFWSIPRSGRRRKLATRGFGTNGSRRKPASTLSRHTRSTAKNCSFHRSRKPAISFLSARGRNRD